MPRFRTTTWQVPGSTGFLGSGRETKHHLWECNLIDCCSHYPVDFLKPLRARARQSQGDTEEEVVAVAVAATAGGETIRSSRRSAVQSPWSPLQLSSSEEFGKQAAKRGKQPKDPHPKKHSAPCFSPRSRRTETQSNPPLCMVVKLNYEAANAFSAADKKVRLFISKEHFLSIPPIIASWFCSKMLTFKVGNVQTPPAKLVHNHRAVELLSSQSFLITPVIVFRWGTTTVTFQHRCTIFSCVTCCNVWMDRWMTLLE